MRREVLVGSRRRGALARQGMEDGVAEKNLWCGMARLGAGGCGLVRIGAEAWGAWAALSVGSMGATVGA